MRGSRSGLAVAAAGALAGIALIVAQAPPIGRFLGRSLLTLSLAGVVALAAFGCASALDRVLARMLRRAPSPPRLELVIVGVPLFGSVCFLVGLFTTHALAMGGVVALGAALGAVRLRGHVRAPSAAELGAGSAAFLALACASLGLQFLVAQLPPTHLDELAYHLQVPKAWAIEGRVVELPLNSHSYFPMGVESASLPFFALAGPLAGQAARSLHWLVACLVSLVMARWMHRVLAPGGAPWTVAVWLTAPCLFAATGLALVEWYLLGACLLALVSLDAWIDGDEGRAVPIALVWAAGMATKYTFGLFALAVAIAGAWHLRRRPEALRGWLGAGAAGVALGSVFALRNLAWTGNPLAPFGGDEGAVIDSFVAETSLRSRALAYVLDPGMLDESLGAALPAAALCGLWALATARGTLGLRTTALLTWVPLCGIALAGYVGRILLPFLLPSVVLGIAAVHRELSGSPRAGRAVLGIWWLLCTGQLVASSSLVAAEEPYEHFFAGGDEYVAKRRSYGLLRWLDERLPEDSTTLVLGLQELYPSHRRVRGGGNADGPRIARYLDADSPASLAERWRRDGFTHVAVYGPRIEVGNAAPAGGLRTERFTVLTKAQATLLGRALAEHGAMLATREGFAVYALR